MTTIKIKNLTKIYNNILVVNKISLSINKSDFFALLGKNGAGKSTTIGILTSLIKKDSGKIFINNYDFDKKLNEIKPLIGFMPQEYNFNQFETILDIILNQAGFYGIKRSEVFEKAKFYLKFFDLWNKKNIIGLNLSGGMKRCLMLIRSIIHNPDILILDEPTAGVDIIHRKLIWNFLKDMNKNGKTIILTTHYLEEVENLCNKVAIIELGKILIETTVKNLLQIIKKNTILLNIENLNKIKNTNLDKFKIVKKNNEIIEILFQTKEELNLILKELIKKNVKIIDIKNETDKLENLFIDLIYDKK